MIEKQIIARGIKDKAVLGAMRKVQRHKFVPEEFQKLAYEDYPLPIGHSQTISQPYIVALMTEALDLNKSSRVLEIGTGSGYQTAVLAEIADKVYTIEIIKDLYERAAKILKELGYKNVYTKYGDGYIGWKEYAPYDGIIVTCAADNIPSPLIEQLKVGGVMCIPVDDVFGAQDLEVLKKTEDGKIIKKIISKVRFVPLTREEKSKE
ncbi:MAG: protein-L-isoaspartate(D-aspartate) O-methyltransferase [Elusimicrobiota bacterium]